MSNPRLLDPAFGDTFESALRRFFAPAQWDTDTPQLKMRIDVTESEKAFNVKADLPGVKKEDINVRVDGNTVQIDAEVKTGSETEAQKNGDKVLRRERHQGAVSRSFSLGQDVDEEKVQASYADGVLSLELPKKAATTGKKINIT